MISKIDPTQQSGKDNGLVGKLALLQQHLNYFLKKFPDDSRAVLARAWWVEISLDVAKGLEITLNQEKWLEELDRLEQAKDVPQKFCADVDAAVINGRLREMEMHPASQQEKMTAQIARLDAFVAKHKRDARRENYALMLGTTLREKDETRADRSYVIAYQSSDPELSARAEIARAALPYYHRPLDLKFTAADGSNVDLVNYRGKVVVLDFWATWCGPCVREVPEMTSFYRDFHPRGVEVIGISLDSDRKTMTKCLKEHGMTWPQYFDGGGWDTKLSRRFKISSIPALWLLDKTGRIVSTDARGELRSLVPPLLSK